MPILALAIVALLVWLVVKRGRPVPRVIAVAALAFLTACVAAMAALRAGPGGAAVFAIAAVALGVWLSLRGRGGDDRGDDGPDRPEPPDPGPGPGRHAQLPDEVLDPDAFDRARAEWERGLREPG